MTLPLFFAPAGLLAAATVGEKITLTGPEARHAVTVKRMGVGESLQLAGDQRLATGTIAAVTGKDAVTITVTELGAVAPRTPQVVVVQALPKAERSELAVDLAVQAGADVIIPWQASRCIAKWTGAKQAKGHEKWVNAALAAAKQSRRPLAPRVLAPQTTATLTSWLQAQHEEYGDGLVIAVLHEAAAVPFAQLPLARAQQIVLIIGPEGGIAPEEITAFTQLGGQAVILGPEVLRTATAAAVALGAIGVLTDRWQPAADQVE